MNCVRPRAPAEENARLKRIVADMAVQINILKAVNAKNGEPGQQAQGGTSCGGQSGLGRVAQACRALSLPRSGYYRVKKVSQSNWRMHNRIVKLSRQHPRYGYRRITALLKREGRRINAKRVARVRRAEGLHVRKRQRRTRRLRPSQAQRLSATRRNEVWRWDFVMGQTESGGAFRILTLIDEHTRQCLATHVAWSTRAQDVLTVLEQAWHARAHPQRQRTRVRGLRHIQDWMAAKQIKTRYIKPGSPWEPERSGNSQPQAARRASTARQNGHIESFHDKLRDECLSREVFGTLAEVRVIIDAWRYEYNKCRPHSSLRYRTPAEQAARCQTPLRSHFATLNETSAAFDSTEEQPNIIDNPRTPKLHL